MEQTPRGLGVERFHRVKLAYEKAKGSDNFDWRMVAQEASVAWGKWTGVEWWIVYHTFKAEILDEEDLVQYNKTWEGMSLSLLKKPPSVVSAPKNLSKVDVDRSSNDDGMNGARGYHLTTEETKVLAALGILKYTLNAWELASEKCWKFVGGNQVVSWEKYLALVYQALMNSTVTRFYKIFTEDCLGVDWLMNLFEGTLQLDLFLNQFEHKSKYPLRSGRGDVWIRIWKCRLEEMMREDLNEATMQGDNADKVLRPTRTDADDDIGDLKLAMRSWKLRGHGRCLRFAEWIMIMETDTPLDALIVKCGKRWSELLKRLHIETTRSGEDIRKDFFAHVLPNLSEFGGSGKKVVRPLNLRDRYTMITICHSIGESSKQGLSKAVMGLLENKVLCDRKKNLVESRGFWMRAFTHICKQKLRQTNVIEVTEFFHISLQAYRNVFREFLY